MVSIVTLEGQIPLGVYIVGLGAGSDGRLLHSCDDGPLGGFEEDRPRCWLVF
jgi:hypothetical protein